MNEYNKEGQQHGPWEGYYLNGKLSSKANYVNGKKHGPWEWYDSNGKIQQIGYYIN